MKTQELRRGGALESENVVDPCYWSDGGPVGADFDGMELVCDGSAWVAPAHLAGPTMKSWVCTPFVRVQPAGVKVSH